MVQDYEPSQRVKEVCFTCITFSHIPHKDDHKQINKQFKNENKHGIEN